MKNNNTQIDKKIFIAGKVYDPLTMGKDTVETSMQTYLDNEIGKDQVRFELYTIGDAVAMFLYRGFDCDPYDANPVKDMMNADVFITTAYEYEGFMMSAPFPTLPVPGFGYPYHISQTDFLDIYCKSARILRVSRIKNASLDVSPVSVILRVQIE